MRHVSQTSNSKELDPVQREAALELSRGKDGLRLSIARFWACFAQ